MLKSIHSYIISFREVYQEEKLQKETTADESIEYKVDLRQEMKIYFRCYI